MLSRVLIFICFTLFNNSLESQEFEFGRLDIEILRKHYYIKLNEYRDSLKLSKITNHSILNKASLDQAEYCNKQNTLSHFQENKNKYSVLNRIEYYNGNFNIVGENCLITFINIPIFNENYQKNIVIKDYKELAESMFLQWKNSPGHHKNIINPLFENSGLSIFLQDNKLYGVEVFAGKEYIKPIIFSNLIESEFDLDENYDPNCIEKNKLDKNIINGLTNYTVRYYDTIKQYYENLRDINSVLKTNKDGLVIDIVMKSQFSCTEDHRLNPKFYDGYLLPPIYKDSLLRGNTMDNNEFLSTLGYIPKGFLDNFLEEFQVNTIYINNKKPCVYSYPVKIEVDLLPLVSIKPILSYNPNQKKQVYNATINLEKKFEIPFKVNSTKLDSIILKRFLLFLSILDPLVESIDIEVYSSIEGSKQKNEQLHKERDQEIRKIISKKLTNSPKINSKSIENWALFYSQLNRYDSIDTLKEKTKVELRNFINNNKLDYKDLLDEQRVAKLSFKLKSVELNSNSLANRILLLDHFIDYKNKNISEDLFNQLVLEFNTKQIESDYLSFINTPNVNFDSFVTSNYLAALVLRINKESDFNLTENELSFLGEVMSLKSTYPPLIYNQIALQISLYYYVILDNIDDFKKLDSTILSLKKNDSYSTDEIERVKYNYYLTGSKFYNEKRKFPLMYSSYFKFKSMLKLQNLNTEETIDIVLYMNAFNDLYSSLQLLEKSINKADSNEKLKFLYVTTGALYSFNNKYKIEFYLSQLDHLIKMDSKLLCPWLNQNFQLLRIDEIKKRICKKCDLIQF